VEAANKGLNEVSADEAIEGTATVSIPALAAYWFYVFVFVLFL
jgi:hypothetical protein